jgi:nucleotide-binding universal stress UspA family protein
MRMFVMDIVRKKSLFPLLLSKKEFLHQQKERVKEMDNFVSETIEKKIPKNVITRIRCGRIVETLIKESIKGGYEFIVIDKSKNHYKGALKRNALNKLISKSHCPVLTINKDYPIKSIKKIVIPIDISQTTKKKLYWATFFAKKFSAKVFIVSAVNIDIEKTKSRAFRNAEILKNMLTEREIECDIKIINAHKQEKQKAILEYIEELAPELVIIRTHQEFRFTGKLIGKFVSEIVHDCKIPVFTVGGPTKNLLEKN